MAKIPSHSRSKTFLQTKPVVYAACSLGFGLMNSVFQFYYVKIYLDYYHVPTNWFHAAQVIYMIWNAINDPLLGYCQDHCQSKLTKSRGQTILYGAPVWAITFLLPWFPWPGFSDYEWLRGLHLIVALCAYDTLFTHVLLAHGCVLTEMAETHEERVKFYWYSMMAHFLGSSSVLFCESLSSHLSSFGAFQICCVIIAIIAGICIAYTGRYAVTKYDLISIEINPDSDTHSNDAVMSHDRSTEYSIFQLTWQLLTQKNFFWFVLVNFCCEFHATFIASMSRIISEVLVSKDVTSIQWEMYCGAIMILPVLVQVILAPMLPRYGYYRAYRVIFILTIVLAIMMYCTGFQIHLFMAFTLLDSILARYSTSIMGLPLSDIADEDFKHYNRRHPVSSMVYGTNALVTKPALSMAPMLAVAIVNRHGYRLYQDGNLEGGGLSELKSAMFQLSCLLPLCIGVLQIILWTKYSLRSSHVKTGKN